MTLKGGKCTGGKTSEERLKFWHHAMRKYDSQKPVIISKAVKPRYFKEIAMSKLNVI